MTSDERKAALQVFASRLEDRPLDPAEPEDRKLYVEELHVEKVDGLTRDPGGRLATQIERALGTRVWLFTGALGSGKSTELRRLRLKLRTHGCVVFLADAADYINLNHKIEIADFLVSVTAAFAAEAGKYLEDNQLESGYWERFKNFLTRTRVEVKEASVSGGVSAGGEGAAKADLKTDLKAELRQDPTVKQRIQEHLRGHLATLSRELEEFRAEVLDKIRKKDGPDVKVVLLLDSLERLRGTGDASDEVFSSVRAMFTQYPDMLRLAELQVVYSVPPYLLALAPNLAGTFGQAALCHMTTAHIFKEHGRALDTDGGVRIVREILTRRYDKWPTLLTEAQLNRIIEASGGDLRDLFRLLSIVLLEMEDSENVDAVITFACNRVRADMAWITEPQRARLRQIAETKHPRFESDADRDELVHDLETKRVLMYRNGDDWYDVHPLLRTLVEESPKGAPGGAG